MTPRIAIIDYGSGNLRSVAKAFERVAQGTEVNVTADAGTLADATHLVLPGVGAFGDCARGLAALPGMREALEREVHQKGKPFLGICVGMQLLFDEGHEHGVHAGLGWISGRVLKLAAQQLKIPHMGWNELRVNRPHALLQGIVPGAHAYFVHSYHAEVKDASCVLATTEYGGAVTAVVGKDNILGTQFHPEKSQETGLNVLKNFLAF